MRIKFKSAIGFLVIAFVWATMSIGDILDHRSLPRIWDVVFRIWSLILNGEVYSNSAATFMRVFLGFSLAGMIGVPLGLLIGSNKNVYLAVRPVMDFFRSLPGTAMFPLFLMLFGIGDGSKIAISVFISFWVILVSSVHGFLYSSPARRLAAKSFGAKKWRIFKDVVLFDALPHVLVGLRNGFSLALIAVVVSEMFVGVDSGLGQKIYDSYLTYEIKDLYAWLVTTGCIGMVCNYSFVLVERRFLHWTGK